LPIGKGIFCGLEEGFIMATKGGKARRQKAALQGLQGCREDNGAATLAAARSKPSPHPFLRAGVFGRVEYVTASLSVLDHRAPASTGRLLPDAPGHPARSLPAPQDTARTISEELPQWRHLTQDGLSGDALRERMGT
jgi:hypothetical protein